MKDENEFNAKLSQRFSRLRPELMHVKVSDRFGIGLSDFILWHRGRSVVIESKFIRDLPALNGNVLKRVFTPEQITFMTLIKNSDTKAYGLIGCHETKSMWLIDPLWLNSKGNLKREMLLNGKHMVFKLCDTVSLASSIFSYHFGTNKAEADEISPEDLEAAAELYDELAKDPAKFYEGKKLMPQKG
jgi:hypothetical protein